MGDFEQKFIETQRAAENAAQMLFAVWCLGLIFACIAAIWIFRDAETRHKSGFAASLLVLVSATIDFRITLIVLSVWILLRPEKGRQLAVPIREELPEKLPSGIVAGPTTSEFLNELESGK